ncbi:MAG: pyruvate kinase [Candidatus Kerfeldbacteria bacterium]|nr:pyruvate kinase [Candidatus Kerfeldbacteria bacterium]
MKYTKIICTIGPASHTKTRLKQMIRAGMNVARLNFSHGDYADHAKLIRTIRRAAQECGRPIALLQDLQGPRIRIGVVPREGIMIHKKDSIVLVSQTEYARAATPRVKAAISIPIQYAKLYTVVKPGGRILIQDGLIELQVERIAEKNVYCRVVQGGVVFSHKGLNAPGVTIPAKVITAKDEADLKFGLSQGIDYVALSFVKDAKDILDLRKRIPAKKRVKIIAKIERAEAVKNFDRIVNAADGIMVARGDLGIEIGSASVPVRQKEMIEQCIRLGKPVIVATQMLESMTQQPRPTRAEASDVANAVIDHTDAVMLSAETASGKFPVETVRMMAEIIQQTEASRFDDMSEGVQRKMVHPVFDLFGRDSIEKAQSMRAKKIILSSEYGEEALALSQLRSQQVRVIVRTSRAQTQRHLALVWGIETQRVKKLNRSSRVLFLR